MTGWIVRAFQTPFKVHRLMSRTMSSQPSEEVYDSSEEYKILDVGKYLMDVLQVLEPKPMQLNETYRKCMLRTLTGIQDINQQLREMRDQLQWEKAIRFANTHVMPLQHKRQGISKQMEMSGADPRSRFQNPIKWFSRIASGKQYQGNFLWLLCDIAPESVNEFREAVEQVDQKHVLLALIDANCMGLNKQAAINCAQLCFPKQTYPSNSMDMGRQSESLLSAFLEEQRKKGSVAGQERTVMENVLVKPRVKRKLSNAPMLLFKSLSKGMTTEFDCMIVEQDGEWIRIHEVWEAKTTLHPGTIYDALGKKFSTLKAILDDDSARFILNGKEFRLSKEMPMFGLFGSRIYSPLSAARRINAFTCTKSMSNDVSAVLKALELGYVRVTIEELMNEVEVFRTVLDTVKPVIAVPRKKTTRSLCD